MTSLVNPSNINGNFPIAGQDNDSQGFRDNFTNIRNNFTFIKAEVEDLQAKSVLKSALTGTALDNNFQGAKVKNLQVSNITETMKDWGNFVGGKLQLDLAEGNVNKIYATAATTIEIDSVIKNWPASLQWARILIYITVPATDFVLQLPSTFTTDLSSIPGLRRDGDSVLIYYTDPGDYIYELSSVDSGTTVFVRELTKGNPVFRDPNFYTLGIGAGAKDDSPGKTGYQSPTLILGFGDYIGAGSFHGTTGVSYLIDNLKSGNDTLLVKGSITSYQAHTTDPVSGLGDTQATSKGIDSLTSAGFSVVKDRSSVTGHRAGVTVSSLTGGELVGYFNALGRTTSSATNTGSTYEQLGTIEFVSNGSSTSPYGLGGNIVIKTKGDGGIDGTAPTGGFYDFSAAGTLGQLRTAMIIDSLQKVTIFGDLDVKGKYTVVESETVTAKDKNLTLGFGGTDTINLGAGITISSDGSTLASPASIIWSPAGSGYWTVNYPIKITSTTDASGSVGSYTGSFVTLGGAAITKDLRVGGAFSLTATTQSTDPTTGAFVLGGGLGVAKNISANGAIFANSSLVSGSLLNTGANTVVSIGSAFAGGTLQVQGGGYITGNLVIAGKDGANGAKYTDGYGGGAGSGSAGLYVFKSNATVDGWIFASNLHLNQGVFHDAYSFDSGASTRNSGVLRVAGGATIQGNLYIGQGDGQNAVKTGPFSSGSLYINNGALGYPTIYTSGGLVAGNTANPVGASITGVLNVGYGSGGGVIINATSGGKGFIRTDRTYTTTPTYANAAITAISGTSPSYGGLTNFGDTQLAGDVYIGQAYNGSYIASGQLLIDSGVESRDYSTGAVVLRKYTLANGYVMSSGMGIAGALNVYGNVNLSTDDNSASYANVVSTLSSAYAGGTAALNVKGGAVITKALHVMGNIYSAGNTSIVGNLQVQGNVMLWANARIAGNLELNSNLRLGVGTATIAPLNFTSGTNQTTPINGSMEYDGQAFYATPLANYRTVINSSHYYSLSTNVALVNGTNPVINTFYNAFGTTAGVTTLAAATTYEVEGRITFGFSSTPTAGTVLFSFGGGASITNYNYQVTTYGYAGLRETAANVSSFLGTTTFPTTTTGVVQSAQGYSNFSVHVKGIIRTNASGTVIPQIGFGTAPAVVASAVFGSYFKFTPVGTSANVAVGSITG